MKNNKSTYCRICNLLIIFLLSIVFSACDGFQPAMLEVYIPVEDVPEVMVLNGEIEKDSTVWVQISYSNDINAPVGTPIRFEKNAIIELKTGKGASEQLKYWRNGIYYGTIIRGEVKETYTLNIDLGERMFSATSTMLPAPGFQGAWVASLSGKDGKGSTYGGYEEEWIVNDPSATRNRYLFEWHTNGVHDVSRDWCIDDNRVVNVNEGLRLINPTRGVNANEHIVFRAAEIDKNTYDYFNMYEKIVRRIIGADSQTPYNPISNFGEGSMGNFRAVHYSSITILTPPNLSGIGQNAQNVLRFEQNKLFTKYHLYWSTNSGVTKESNVLKNIDFKIVGGDSKDGGSKSSLIDGSTAFFIHKELENGQTYFYRIEVEDAHGVVSVLSPEFSLTPDPNVPAEENPNVGSGNNIPTNVTAITGKNEGEVIITWTDVLKAESHGIYWSETPGIKDGGKNNAIWPGKGASKIVSPFAVTGLTSGKTYYFKVAAWDGAKVNLSEEVSALAK